MFLIRNWVTHYLIGGPKSSFGSDLKAVRVSSVLRSFQDRKDVFSGFGSVAYFLNSAAKFVTTVTDWLTC